MFAHHRKHNIFRCLLVLVVSMFAITANAQDRSPSGQPAEYDVVVYGGTSAGVIAAVQAKKMGKSAIIVCPDKHLGGLSSGGLGFTDTGNKAVIGGLSREFYHRVWKTYQSEEAWRWQKREEYGNKGQGTPAIDGQQRTMWIFEPHVAEAVFEDFIREYNIPVHREEWLDRKPGQGVEKQGPRIKAIKMLSGKTYPGKMFIDATYEGDLMASAGVMYHVGREANSVYGEKWNGIQVGVLHHGHWFKKPISPYIVPGDPASGLLPRISPEPPGEKGQGDKRVQAYCYRMCLTNHDPNRVPFPKPKNYDPKQYELLLRVFETGWREVFNKFDPIPNRKTDTNNHGPFSTDNIGYNYDYPEGSYERRREILEEHQTYQKGLMYFIANDPRVPEDVRSKMATWGLAKDEFTDNSHWPHQIYVREARRMVGEYVMTEHDCLDTRETPDSVGMGSYTIDSHNVQRYVTPEGSVQNEGDIGVGTPRPYEIAYGSLVPRKSECQNLLVPVCLSSSHIAFGSIRMEPVFMILGQSAATAAVLSMDEGKAVQDLEYEKLRAQLLEEGQILEMTDASSLSSRKMAGIVVDDRQAKLQGEWASSSVLGKYVDVSYLHDGDRNKGGMSAEFSADLKPGRYEVRIAYSAGSNRATNVPVVIHHQGKTTQATINQKQEPEHEGLTKSVGSFDFDGTGKVVISNAGTDAHVIIDAVQFLPAGK
jgi:hypothetical protein